MIYIFNIRTYIYFLTYWYILFYPTKNWLDIYYQFDQKFHQSFFINNPNLLSQEKVFQQICMHTNENSTQTLKLDN